MPHVTERTRRVLGFFILTIGTLLGQTRSRNDLLADNMLAAHNAVRRGVGVPPLLWSDRLAAFAQRWADTLAPSGQFFHRRNSPYGENSYEITGAITAPGGVVSKWAAESRNYYCRSNTCRGLCCHFTQIVWRGTRNVGCAAARSGWTEVWVCNYDPPGNWIGQSPY